MLPLSQTVASLNLWSKILLRSMQSGNLDLSTRQMAILLSIYLSDTPHSVKSLSEHLGISKAAICRALDVLSQAGFIKRKRVETDKRQVLLSRTIKGMIYLSDVAEVIRSEALQFSQEVT